MASRSLTDLLPQVGRLVEAWVTDCMMHNVIVLVYCTYRSAGEQNELYAQGRTKPGRIVTYAVGGRSWHQWRRAVDAVPLWNGKPLWNYDPEAPEWETAVRLAEAVGLEWAGRWPGRRREYVHFQYREGLRLTDLQTAYGMEMPLPSREAVLVGPVARPDRG